jgi:hypothetical protein
VKPIIQINNYINIHRLICCKIRHYFATNQLILKKNTVYKKEFTHTSGELPNIVGSDKTGCNKITDFNIFDNIFSNQFIQFIYTFIMHFSSNE